MKIIIIGAGEVGFNIAQKLSEEGQDVILIDKDPEKVRRITEELDVGALLGSGTSPKVLTEAGLKEADLLIAATNSDETNIIACLLAQNMNQLMHKVARIRNEEYLEHRQIFNPKVLGIDHIINPQSAMVENILSLMEVPGAVEVIDFVGGKVKLIAFSITHDSPLAGQRLRSLTKNETKILIGAIVREDRVIVPRGEDTIEPDDLIYVVTSQEQVSYTLSKFDIDKEELRRVVIVGAGQTGRALARALEAKKIHTKIIEKDEVVCEELAEELDKVTVIHGDGTAKGLLQEEAVEGADFFVVLTGDEENNILISLLAKGLGVKQTITRVNKLSYIPILSAIGIDTVVSTRLSAVKAILQYIRKGKIFSVTPIKGEYAEAIEAEALETSEIVGAPLKKVKFPKGTILGGIVRNEQVIIPRGDTVVRPGDRLVIFALRGAVPKLEKLLTVKLDYF